jgi:Fur family transcriptional regulator, ferric uptake regulator
MSATPPRQTRQRAAVQQALAGRDEFTSAQQLHDILRRQGASVGLTTVYRSLQALAESGEVDQIVNDEGEAVYRRCSAQHHHHLVCRECGRTVEIAGPAVETWADHVAADHGFTQVSHTLELFGVCAACSASG